MGGAVDAIIGRRGVMTRNHKATASVFLILGGIVGLEIGGLGAVITSIFAIGVGLLAIKNAILD